MSAQASDTERHELSAGLLMTSGAMFLGLLGVYFFSSPGGVIGAAAGVVLGLLVAQRQHAS